MQFQRPDIIRPPSEWRDYFLPLTRGCSNNTCTFCNRWGEKLHLRDLEDVKREIDALALFMHRGLTLPEIPPIVYAVAQEWDGNDVFLLDSDALVYPFPKLKEALAIPQSQTAGHPPHRGLCHRAGRPPPHRRGAQGIKSAETGYPLYRTGERRRRSPQKGLQERHCGAGRRGGQEGQSRRHPHLGHRHSGTGRERGFCQSRPGHG